MERSIRKATLLNPISDFIEPIYTGQYAGNMVRFSSPSTNILTAAGIWEAWVGKGGEIIESFSILSDEPISFVRDIGHDRSPVFMSEQSQEEWLTSESKQLKEWVEFLRANTFLPELNAEIDRPMKVGWEKRV